MSGFPRMEKLLTDSLADSLWTTIENVPIPYLNNDGKKFVPVKILEDKILRKYSHLVNENFTMPHVTSHPITEIEAYILNTLCAGQYTFSQTDLVVDSDEFLCFFRELGKFCAEQICGRVTGGWVQINNAVVPYVVKNAKRMAPLSIVQNAAGLLVNDIVHVQFPNDKERTYLNDLCKSAGLVFNFISTTSLFDLLILTTMKSNRPTILDLPTENPFSAAQYINVEDISSRGLNAVMPNGVHTSNSVCGNLIDARSEAIVPQSDAKDSPVQVDTYSLQSEDGVLPARDSVLPAHQHETIPQKTDGTLDNSSVTLMSSSSTEVPKHHFSDNFHKLRNKFKNVEFKKFTKDANSAAVSARAKTSDNSEKIVTSTTHADEDYRHRIQRKRGSTDSVGTNMADSEEVQIVSVLGKDVCCLKIRNEMFVPVAFVCRLFTPHCSISLFSRVLNHFGAELFSLSEENTARFNEYFKLPSTAKWPCGKIIEVGAFERCYRAMCEYFPLMKKAKGDDPEQLTSSAVTLTPQPPVASTSALLNSSDDSSSHVAGNRTSTYLVDASRLADTNKQSSWSFVASRNQVEPSRSNFTTIDNPGRQRNVAVDNNHSYLTSFHEFCQSDASEQPSEPKRKCGVNDFRWQCIMSCKSSK